MVELRADQETIDHTIQFVYSTETAESDRLLTRWTEQRGDVIVWEALRERWDGMTSTASIDTWERLETVQIKGKVPWLKARSVDLTLRAPIPPISTTWQKVSKNSPHFAHPYTVSLRASKRPLIKQARAVLLAKKMDERLDPSVNLEHVSGVLHQILDQLQRQTTTAQETSHTIKLDPIVRAVLDWIKENIKYELHSGVPSVDVTLRRRSGDCNEISQLFVFLMASLGIKAQMVFGLIHLKDQQWGYHAWASVSDGLLWYDVDPSRGHLALTLGYLAFSRGTLDQQNRLQRLIGQTEGKVIYWSR